MTIVQPVTIAEHAAHYAAAGWEIFPGNPRTKAPLWDRNQHVGAEHGMNDATTDPDLVAVWWQRWPDALICHRIPPGVVLLDVDVRHGGDAVWLKIRDELGPLPATRTHHSGRGDGGGHVWYRHTIGKLSTVSLDEWARNRGVGQGTKTGGWTAGIDLLHHGHRYTILPPSPHPDTGQPYTWKTTGDADIAELPDGLVKLLTAIEPATPVNGNGTSSLLNPGEDSIADWYSANHTIDELLERHQWTRVGRNGNDGQKWRHPQASNAHSATVRHGCLFVYTPTPGLPVTEPGDPHGLTPFRLYAYLEHCGDMSAAGAAARIFKDGPRERPDLSWAQPSSSTPALANDGQPDEAWPDPLPLVDVDTPPFPLEVLPAWIGDHCEAVADRIQVPPDLCAQLALGVLATLAMGHVRIHVTNSWEEPANLYLATVMPSGAGKSPADKFMVTPLRRLEAQLLEQSDLDRKKAEHERSIAEKRARKLSDKAAGAEDSQQAEMDAWAAQQRADAIEAAPEPRLLASDVTPEMLAVLLSRHNGRIAIVSTEADLYDVVLGSYSKRPNVSVLLKAWSGDEVIVDRKGGSGTAATAIRIPEALLTISITVQPIALAALRRERELEMKGFVPRFMHSWPVDLIGTRDHHRALDDRPLTTTTAYDTHILDIGAHCAAWALPADIRYHPDAARHLVDWRQQLETSLAADRELAHLATFVPKIVGSTARLAGLLHLADRHPLNTPLDTSTVDRAVTIGRYWLAHAGAVLAQGGGDLVGAERILNWIRRTQPEQFERRDIQRAMRTTFKTAADVDLVLERLEITGHIRTIGERHKGSARRNSVYAPHPQLLTGGPA